MLKKNQATLLRALLALFIVLGCATHLSTLGHGVVADHNGAQSDRHATTFIGIVVVYPLNVTVTANTPSNTATIQPGDQVAIDVRVSYGNYPVQNASVSVSASLGTLMPSSGLTDFYGVLAVEFVAPTVPQATTININATASHAGYWPGNGGTQLTVEPIPPAPSSPVSSPFSLSGILSDLLVPAIVSLAAIALVTTSFLLVRRIRTPKSKRGSPPELPHPDLETERGPTSSPQGVGAEETEEEANLAAPSSPPSYRSPEIGSATSGRTATTPAPESDYVTGRVSVQATIKPSLDTPLNVALIGEKMEEETKILRGRIVEKRPFQPSGPGPILIRPHGKVDGDFKVRPLTRSSGIPRTGEHYDFDFNITYLSDVEGPTKLFVDFEQDGRLLARANADVKISKVVEPEGTLQATVHVPYVPLL